MKCTIRFSIFILLLIVTVSSLSGKSPRVQAKTNSFRFVAWGDTKSGLSALLSKQIAPLKPKFTLYSGDLEDFGFTISGTEAWKKAVNGDITGTTNNNMFDKTFPVRGNHDNGNTAGWPRYHDISTKAKAAGGTNYIALTPDLTYSFDYGNSHFVGIDVPGDITFITSNQTIWLDSDLTTAENRGLAHAFIFFHGPIYAVDGHCCPTAPKSFINVINNHPIVTATFHGHEHVSAFVQMNNARYSGLTHTFQEFVVGNAGAPLYQCASGRSDWCYDQNNGFAAVDVSDSGYTINFYAEGNTSPIKTLTFNKYGSVSPANVPPARSKPIIQLWSMISTRIIIFRDWLEERLGL